MRVEPAITVSPDMVTVRLPLAVFVPLLVTTIAIIYLTQTQPKPVIMLGII